MEIEINKSVHGDASEDKKCKRSAGSIPVLNLFLLFSVVALVGANQVLIGDVNKKMGIEYDLKSEVSKITAENKISENAGSATGEKIALTGDIGKDSINLIISKGVPAVYGPEMKVSYDDVQGAINIMRQYDPYDLKPKGTRIIPQGDNLQRYIAIAGKISCEYCCGAASIINPKSGQSACGCAHSMAMRGLAAYLIEKHGSEYSNDEILRELARWKGMYFPKQMIKKMTEQLQSGKYTPDTAAILLGLELPKYSESSVSAPNPTEIENLPSMVGGC